MESVYLFCAAIGGTLLVVQLAASLIGLGGDDLGEAVDAELHEGRFVGIFSLRAMTGAVAFFGLGGMAGRAAGFERNPTLVLALVSGLAALYLVAVMVRWLRALASEGNVRIKSAVGKPGVIYVAVPGGNAGQGKVTVTTQNRTVEFAAMTPHPAGLPTGTSVVVTAVVNPDTLEVMPELVQPENPDA